MHFGKIKLFDTEKICRSTQLSILAALDVISGSQAFSEKRRVVSLS
jgi:hypothetical protein